MNENCQMGLVWFQSKMVTQDALELTSFHGYTKFTTTHRRIPSKRNLETSRATPTHWANKEKHPHQNGQERLRHILLTNLIPGTVTYNQEGTHSSYLSLRSEEFGRNIQCPQHLILPPKGWTPIHLTLRVNWTCVYTTLKTITNKQIVLNGPSRTCHGQLHPHPTPTPHRKGRRQKCLSPHLSLKEDLFAYFKSCCLQVSFQLQHTSMYRL